MTKITLEDVAVQIGTVWVSDAQIKSDEWWTEAASLCRSAQAVIEAARGNQNILGLREWMARNGYGYELHQMGDALAAHAKNEQGTGEQP